MKKRFKDLFAARESADRDAAYQAFVELMAAAEEPVDWSYDVWDQMVEDLTHKQGSKRAFAAQMLARLAISDPDERMLDDFAALAAVMRDDKPVTARHTLQSIWRVGLAGSKQKDLVIDALVKRFRECASERLGSLVRIDALISLGNLARETEDPAVAKRAAKLIASERDDEAQKQQRACWKKATGQAIQGT